MSSSWELKAEKREKESQKKDYERRREDVEKLLTSVQSNFDGEIEDVNTVLEKTAEQQENGFENFSHIGTVSLQIRAEKEKSVYSDTCMSGIQGQLVADINDTNAKINNLNSEIEDLENRIRAAEAAEEEERRRAREAEEERIRQFWASMFGKNS